MQAADELDRDDGHDLRRDRPAQHLPLRLEDDLAERAEDGRVLIVNEDTEVTNFGEHLLRRVVDEHFYDLTVRPRMLMGKHVRASG